MQKITPFLWFDDQAEEAANFYVSIFSTRGTAKVTDVSRYGAAGAQAAGRPEGSAMTVSFQLDGQEFIALNGGPEFKFTEAVSFMVECEDQSEVDELWEKLSEGGEEGPCGWLKDRDPKKAERVMAAMLQMKKIDIAGLKKAYDQD